MLWMQAEEFDPRSPYLVNVTLGVAQQKMLRECDYRPALISGGGSIVTHCACG